MLLLLVADADAAAVVPFYCVFLWLFERVAAHKLKVEIVLLNKLKWVAQTTTEPEEREREKKKTHNEWTGKWIKIKQQQIVEHGREKEETNKKWTKQTQGFSVKREGKLPFVIVFVYSVYWCS